MKRIEILSSAIKSVGYNTEQKTLEIEFISESIYHYFQVPITIYKEILQAESPGRYFHENIANQFNYSQIKAGAHSYYSYQIRKKAEPISEKQIRKLRNALAHIFHPDKVRGDGKKMRQINNLYDERNYAALASIAKEYGIDL